MLPSLLHYLSGCNIISTHPQPLQKPHCDSRNIFSAMDCKHSCMILARILPTASSRLIPLQLSQSLKTPFLWIRTTSASFHSSKTWFFSIPLAITDVFFTSGPVHHRLSFHGGFQIFHQVFLSLICLQHLLTPQKLVGHQVTGCDGISEMTSSLYVHAWDI